MRIDKISHADKLVGSLYVYRDLIAFIEKRLSLEYRGLHADVDEAYCAQLRVILAGFKTLSENVTELLRKSGITL